MLRINRRQVISVLSFLILLSSPVSAKIQHKVVRATGTGPTINDAINNALSEAIGRVNGKSIETTTQLNRVAVSVANKNDLQYFSSDAYKKSINTATKGVVSSYDVVSKRKDSNDKWEIELSVKVAKFVGATGSNRKRIAVMPLWVSKKSFLIENNLIDNRDMGRIFGQNLVSYLVQSRRFTVLDREFIKETLGERKLIVDGNTPVEEMARLGQDLVADYILAGVLEDVNFTTTQVKMQTSNRHITTRSGRFEFSYRIIDVDTRQIVFSDFARFKFKDSDIRRVDSSIGNKNVESILCILAAEKVSRKILEAIYPIAIVSVSGNNVILNQGGSGVKAGDRFDVFELGNRIVDPYTKEYIGKEEIFSGTIEITRVNPKQSYARIIKAERDIGRNFQPKKFICRAAEKVSSKTNYKKTTKTKRPAKEDDDW
jgi:curli biogenesis system outer membrane secretion channel CsgG